MLTQANSKVMTSRSVRVDQPENVQRFAIDLPLDLHRELTQLSKVRGTPLKDILLVWIVETWDRQPEHGPIREAMQKLHTIGPGSPPRTKKK